MKLDSQRKLPWAVHVAALRAFRKRHGHCRVPVHYRANPRLGIWLMNQRVLMKQRRLPGDRLKTLQSLGVTSDQRKARAQIYWNNSFQRLVEFQAKHGHTLVSSSSGWLGQWVHLLRRQARLRQLAPDRRRQLNQIGFQWEVISVEWERNFARLHEFHRGTGHYNVPSSHRIAQWVGKQRERHRQGRLDAAIVKRLDAIGFEWTKGPRHAPAAAAAWERNVAALLQFKNRHGHTRVPGSRTGRRGLGVWVSNLRQDYRAGDLSPERVAQLERLGFVWNCNEESWQKRIQRLLDFKKQYGHPNVPDSYRDRSLAYFVANLRVQYRRGNLDPDRLRTLTKMGMIWRFK